MDETRQSPARPRRRWRRPLRYSLLALGLILLLPVLLLMLVVWTLDTGLVRPRVRAAVRSSAGLDVDYGAVRLRPGTGLVVHHLRVPSPAPYDQAAPDLLTVGQVQARVALRSDQPVEEIALRDVHLFVVQGADGKDSLTALLDRLPKPQEAQPAQARATPLSQLLRELLPPGVPLSRVVISGCRLTHIQLPGGERTELSGLGLSGTFARTASGTALEAAIGPAELKVVRTGPKAGTLTAGLHIGLRFAAGRAELQASLQLDGQDLEPRLPPLKQVLSLAAQVEPTARGVRLSVPQLALMDGLATARLQAHLADAPAEELLIEKATASVDLKGLARLLPPALMRISLARGELSLAAAGLALPALRVQPGGELRADGVLEQVSATQGAARVELARAGLSARGELDGARSRVTLSLPVRGLRAAGFSISDLDLSAQAERSGPLGQGPLTAQVALDLKQLGGPDRLDMRRLLLRLSAKDVTYDAQAPLRSSGGLALTGQVGSLSLGTGRDRVAAERLGVEASARLAGGPPQALSARARFGRLALPGSGRGPAIVGPGQLDLTLSGLRIDADHPGRSGGSLKAVLALPPHRIDLAASKSGDSATYDASVELRSLALLRPFMGRESGLPLSQIGAALTSRGTIHGLSGAAPSITHRTALRLDRPALRGTLSADRIEAQIDSSGSARKHAGEVRARLAGLVVSGHRLGDSRIEVRTAVDLARPSLTLHLSGQGQAGPDGQLDLSADVDGKRTIHYKVSGRLGRLGLAEGLLRGQLRQQRVDWPRLGVRLSGEGEIAGVVRAVGRDGSLALVQDPAGALRGTQVLDLTVSGLHYESGRGQRLDLPEAGLRLRHEGTSAGRSGRLEATLQSAHLVDGDRDLRLSGLKVGADVALAGGLHDADGRAEVALRLDQATVSDVPVYPIGGVTLAATVTHRADGVWGLSGFRLHNERGGTTLVLDEGGLEERATRQRRDRQGGDAVIPGRVMLSLRGRLSQDLSRLKGPGRSRGTADLGFRVESGDLALFYTEATLGLHGVDLTLPDQDLKITGLRGRIPVVVDWTAGQGGAGLRLLGNVRLSAFPRLRFADHHPFLSGGSYIAAERIERGTLLIGPLAGNVRVDRNLVFMIDQLEAQVRGGTITGQLAVDYRGADTEVQLRGAATGVRPADPKNGERLDVNGALTFGLRRRSLAGRVELSRIGRGHLLDLLDLLDPHHEQVSINRIRQALKIGYPRSGWLRFEHGFANLSVSLGGVGSAVRIDEVRGVAIEPVLKFWLDDRLKELEK